MESTSLVAPIEEIWAHSSNNTSLSIAFEVIVRRRIFRFRESHRCSIGFKSGDCRYLFENSISFLDRILSRFALNFFLGYYDGIFVHSGLYKF